MNHPVTFFELLMLCMLQCSSGRADAKPDCADPASTRVMWLVFWRHTLVLPASIHHNHRHHAHSVEQFGTAGSHETQVFFPLECKTSEIPLTTGCSKIASLSSCICCSISGFVPLIFSQVVPVCKSAEVRINICTRGCTVKAFAACL